MSNIVLDAIRDRRSVREFTDETVDDQTITAILDAGRWAPSGLNNQPWRFIVIGNGGTIDRISQCTKYSDVVRGAPLLITVFLDTNAMYDRTKDVQAIGACIQNMLLAIHSMSLGVVWLGEILSQKEKVNEILDAPDSLELMAVLAIGHPTGERRASTRKAIREIAYKERYDSPWE